MSHRFLVSGLLTVNDRSGYVRGHLDKPEAFKHHKSGSRISVELKHLDLAKGTKLRITIEEEPDETDFDKEGSAYAPC